MMQFVELNEGEFREFAKSHIYRNFWQTIEMANLRKQLGGNIAYVGVKDNDKILAATMLSDRPSFMGRRYFQAMRGYLIDYRNEELLNFFHQHLISYVKKRNAMYLKIDPYIYVHQRDHAGELVCDGFNNEDITKRLETLGYQHQGYTRGYDDLNEPRWLYYRDLDVDQEEVLLKSFDQQTRWSINKTIKLGIQVREIAFDEIKEFKKMMEHTCARRGFIDHTLEYYEAMYQSFKASNKLKMLFAELDLNIYEKNMCDSLNIEMKNKEEIDAVLLEQPNSKKFNKKRNVCLEAIAGFEKKLVEIEELRKDGDVLLLSGAIFIHSDDEIMYLFSGAYEKYMSFCGPYAIQWYMMKYALLNGYKRYNFYGISGVFEKSGEDYGIYEFKDGFKGEVGELIGDFIYVCDSFYYSLYQSLRKLKHCIKR